MTKSQMRLLMKISAEREAKFTPGTRVCYAGLTTRIERISTENGEKRYELTTGVRVSALAIESI